MNCKAVACCPPNTDEAGYATPAAMVFALTLAIVGASMVVRSVELLQLSRNDYQKVQIDYGLGGAQLSAAASVVRSTQDPPYRWTLGSDVGWLDVRAEPEQPKLTLDAASSLPDAALTPFGVTDAAGLRARLAAQSDNTGMVDISRLDRAPLWRLCSALLISSHGGQVRFKHLVGQEPTIGSKLASWRVGEVWRITATTATGWRDERIVRFTGDAHHPAAVVVRRLTRGEIEGARCDTILAAVEAAQPDVGDEVPTKPAETPDIL